MKDLVLALKTPPLHAWQYWLPWTLLYAAMAMAIGFSTRLFQVHFLDMTRFWFLPITLFVFPCWLEELFFRGFLIRRPVLDEGYRSAIQQIGVSALLFTLWHPLNAATVNPSAQAFFYNPWFLLITFFLGLTCGYAYARSRSIWTPVLIHWLTVLVWVLCLGGRNLILE